MTDALRNESGDAGYRDPPPEPRCPICHGPVELLDHPIAGRDKWCPVCNLPCTGSPIEAQDHAARIAADQAEAMAARAALERHRGET